jgi:Na+-driven multidrug efflux pump
MFLGIPLMLSFTFDWGFGWGVKGIWLAFGISNLVLAVLFITIIFISDWEKQSELIAARIQE